MCGGEKTHDVISSNGAYYFAILVLVGWPSEADHLSRRPWKAIVLTNPNIVRYYAEAQETRFLRETGFLENVRTVNSLHDVKR